MSNKLCVGCSTVCLILDGQLSMAGQLNMEELEHPNQSQPNPAVIHISFLVFIKNMYSIIGRKAKDTFF